MKERALTAENESSILRIWIVACSAGAQPPRAQGVAGDMPTARFSLTAAKLASSVWSQQRGQLLMGHFGLTLGRAVFLLETEPGPVEQRFDGALGHLQGARDLAVAQVLQLAKREDQAVLLGQPLSDGPDPPSRLGRFLHVDWIETSRR